MKDLITAICGRSYCGWCRLNTKPSTRWERLMRFDVLGGPEGRPWWERAAMHWANFNDDTLQIWRLGEAWHYRFHARYKFYGRYRHGRWTWGA